MLQAPHSHLVVPLRQPPHAARRTPSPPYRPAPPPAVPQRLPTPPLSPVPVKETKSSRSRSSVDDADVLSAGDVVAPGHYLNGELVREVSRRDSPGSQPQLQPQPGHAFEIVRKLGTGSYAVVYLVRERLDRLPDSDDDEDDDSSGDSDVVGPLDLDQPRTPSPAKSAPVYGREFAIKCLSKANLGHEALQAQLLEATIHQSLPVHSSIVTLYRTLESDSLLLLLLELVPGEDLFYFLEQARDHQSDSDHPTTTPSDLSVTPPTPSLLSSFQPHQLLTHGRLRLIASMFAQMCDAVATCHEHGVAHRDIKPENFIVTDVWSTNANGTPERRVVVKLTDFGLATTDIESADMECGSAPYMSHECRNNLAPTYFPRPADVWSLGIVLINMLYHRNPWADTSIGVCSAFDQFRDNAFEFFYAGFFGMTREVAEYLADSVFCILETPDDTRRVTARDFGVWAKNLPNVMAPRRPSIITDVGPTVEEGQQKRTRKRGARKGKGSQNAAAVAAASLPSPEDDHLDHLASASQDLVRELSRLSTRSSANSLQSSLNAAPPVPALPSPQRKTSRWKGVFGLQKQPSSSSLSPAATPAPTPAPPPVQVEPAVVEEDENDARAQRQMSATVSNVSSIIMGLSPDERGRKRERDEQSLSAEWEHPASASPSRVRNVSPTSTRSRNAPLAPSFKSSNWRNSMMSSTSSVVTGAGSSYTRFSNASSRSVSTANTSVSASSWRTTASSNKQPLRRPANVKDMSGVPWVLHELPRQCEVDPHRELFGRPQQPKKAGANSRPSGGLTPISEGRQQQQNATKPVLNHAPSTRSRLSVSTSSTDAVAPTAVSPPQSPTTPPSDDGPKKVNKGQINTLAKILSSLKSR